MTHPQTAPSQRILSAKHINYDTTHPLYRETGTQYELEWQGVLKRKSFQQTPIGIVREIQSNTLQRDLCNGRRKPKTTSIISQRDQATHACHHAKSSLPHEEPYIK